MERDDLKKLTEGERLCYFFEHSGYMPDAPSKPYVIRTGSRSLTSDDTMDLLQQWEEWVRD